LITDQLPTVFSACIAYLVIIFSTRHFMQYFKNPIPLKAVFMLHNVLLTLVSLSLLLLFIEQLFPIIARHGLFFAVCNDAAWTQPIELLYYLNYLVKYWELADTMFLALKKKKLGKLLNCWQRYD
jgi:fatty acid elongase 3